MLQIIRPLLFGLVLLEPILNVFIEFISNSADFIEIPVAFGASLGSVGPAAGAAAL